MLQRVRVKVEAPLARRQFSQDEWSKATGLVTGEESMVQQHFAEECDINNIVRRFGLTNVMRVDPLAVYGDFSGISDYESAQAMVDRVEEGFSRLPPEVRERFGNDAAIMARYVSETGDFSLGSPEQVKPVEAVSGDPSPSGDSSAGT